MDSKEVSLIKASFEKTMGDIVNGKIKVEKVENPKLKSMFQEIAKTTTKEKGLLVQFAPPKVKYINVWYYKHLNSSGGENE